MIQPGIALGAVGLALAATTLLGVAHAHGRITSLEEFVSARDTTGMAPLTASLIASTVGTWVLFSPAEAAISFGGITAVFGYAVGLGLPLATLAVVGVRVRRLVPHGHSVTEYVLARYGSRMYALVLGVSATYMFVFLAVELTGIAAALAIVAEVPPALTAGLVGLFVFVYTGYGGLLASIVTDTLQALVMLPLLVASFVGVLFALDGAVAVRSSVVAADPSLLSLTNPAGLRFGLYVGLALLGANVLNQGLWQRVYAAESERTLRRAFGLAAGAVVPVVLLSGLFGLGAAGLDLVEHGGHAALFGLLLATEPVWLVLPVVVLAVLLVMTSADTLINGLVSLALHDLPRAVDRLESEPGDHDRDELLAARLLTAAVALVAMVIGAMQFSEIRLFLTVDLLCAATFVPVVAGLYTGEIPEWGAVAASAVGFALGLGFDPVVRPLLGVALPAALTSALPAPSFAASFGAAVGASLLVTAASAGISGESADLEHLERHVRQLGEGDGEGDA